MTGGRPGVILERFLPRPQILRWPARGHFGKIFAKLRTICVTTGSGGAGMQQPRAGDAARDAGAAAAGRTPPSGTPAASGCAACAGVCCAPCVRCLRAAVPHRRAGPQAACNMHVRAPASARVRARAVRPRARASARHTHASPTILSVLPAGSRRGVCARGRPPISCSLSLTDTLTVARLIV